MSGCWQLDQGTPDRNRPGEDRRQPESSHERPEPPDEVLEQEGGGQRRAKKDPLQQNLHSVQKSDKVAGALGKVTGPLQAKSSSSEIDRGAASVPLCLSLPAYGNIQVHRLCPAAEEGPRARLVRINTHIAPVLFVIGVHATRKQQNKI